MPDAERKPEEDHETWKVDINLVYSILFVCCAMLPHFIGKNWQKVRDSSRHVRRCIGRVLQRIPLVGSLFGAESQQKLLFVPDADNKPGVQRDISQAALFRFLLHKGTLQQLDEAKVEILKMLDVLKDIDKNSKITEFETHQSSMMKGTDFSKAFHVFIVFKTTSQTDGVHWWSLEKNSKYIVLQRSRNRNNVKTKLYGVERKRVKPIKEGLKGKGAIKDLFTILWAQKMIPEKYHIKRSNCQSFVTFVSKQITEEGYEYKGVFNYSPPESGWEKEMLDLINILTGLKNFQQWHPIFHFIYFENIDFVDQFIASGEYDINALYNGLTPLHFAIMFSKTKMVQHLLQPPHSADPTRRDGNGRDALQLAAKTTMNAEIFDLLLAHPKVNVDDVDGDEPTALHSASLVSNVTAVQKLLDKGANPNIVNNWSHSPLHVAAHERDGCPIIDLLLEAKKVKGLGNVNDQNKEGRTALHCAAAASNEITAEHLIEKGADVNHRDNEGLTPLHAAALWAKDMNIIDVILNNINERDKEQYRNDKILFLSAKLNENGLEVEIGDRFLKKGIKPLNTETDDCSAKSEEATRFVEEIIDKFLEDGLYDIDNGRDENGHTPLFLAIATNSVDSVRRLLERGADPTVRDNNGFAPIHLAVIYDTDSEIINLLLANKKVDINETTTQQGWTALHIAIIKSNVVLSHVTTARFLLSKGANPNVANKNGLTPLHLAAMWAKDMDIVELLLNNPKVEVNLMDNEGQSALDYARKNKKGHGKRIANLLKGKGAVESENNLPKVNKEFFKKHIRDYSNRKPGEIENILSDDTITKEEKFNRILEEYLASAIRDRNVERVRLLSEKGETFSERGEYGENVLHRVSFYAKTTNLIDVILEMGKLDINGGDSDGRTPLHYAILGFNPAINTAHLLQKEADPNVADKNGVTPLHLAATSARNRPKQTKTIVKLLVNHRDVNVNCLDKYGNNALHCAMVNKHRVGKAIANLLREKTVLLKAEGNNHEPENIAALVDSHKKTIRFLIESGQDISAMTWGENGANALHVLAAADEETTDLINAILETEKLDINGVDNDGWTPLHYAIMGYNPTKNVPHLIQLGADPNIANKNGITPLHLAAKNDETTQLIDIVLETKKCNINGVDGDGRTPLHYAIKRPKPITINARRLIKMGADPSIADKNGVTPLHMAAIYAESMDLIELLLNTKKLEVNDYDDNALTARDYARYNKHGLRQKIVNRLKDYTKIESPTKLSASHTIIFVCVCLLAFEASALQNMYVFMLK